MKHKLSDFKWESLIISFRSILIIKFSIVFLIIGSLSVSANAFAQPEELELQMEEQTLKQLLDEIEDKTEYRFIYSSQFVDLDQTIDITSNNVVDVLEEVCKENNLEYKIIGNNKIVLSPAGSELAAEQQEPIAVTGKVIGQDGQPVPGANVVIKGTGTGTITDLDGNFSITVPGSDAILVISFIGHTTQEITVGNQESFDITLLEESTQLDEVVVTALGIKREKKALGYSVTEVKGESLEENRSLNMINSLSGQVAGVDIKVSNTGPGGSSKVIIRGNSSLKLSNQPLYVVDGMPIDNQTIGSANDWGGTDLGDGISSINPSDIESISVLKGPSAAALYGDRASNGVILITTKKSSVDKGIGVEFHSNVTFETVPGQFEDVQLVYGQGGNNQLPLNQDAARQMSSWGVKMDPNVSTYRFDGQIVDYGVKSDPIKSFYRTGSTISNTIAIDGASEKATVRATLTNLTNNDIIPNSGLMRNHFSLRATYKPSENLSIDAKVTYMIEDVKNRPFLSKSTNNIGLTLMHMPASVEESWYEDRYNEDGSYKRTITTFGRPNPYFVINDMSNDSEKNRLTGFLEATYSFTDWLSLRLKGGIDDSDFYHFEYMPRVDENQTGQMSEIFLHSREANAEFLLSANKQVNEKIYISGSLGGNVRKNESRRNEYLGLGEVISGVEAIQNFNDHLTGSVNPRMQTNSLFALAQFAYNNFLFVDVTARNDWNSTLPANNNSYFYPSISTGLIFTELLDINTNIFSFGKIRASYAEVGGGVGQPYQLDLYYETEQGTSKPAVGISNEKAPPNDLKPSRTRGFETGLDLRFYNGRLNADLTYYNQVTNDEIIDLQVPTSSGYQYAVQNAAEITNKGFEVLLSGTPIKVSDFQWDLSVNFAINDNEIGKISDYSDKQELSQASWRNSVIYAEKGKRWGTIYGLDFLRNENGEIIHTENGLPMINNDPVLLGYGSHDWTGGLSNTLTYKGFILKFLVDIKYGADLFSMTNMDLYDSGRHIETLEGRQDFFLDPENGGYNGGGVIRIEDASAEGGYRDEPNNVNVSPYDYWTVVTKGNVISPFIYDASYVKLRQLTFGYTFSENLLRKTPFRSLNLAFVANNLWTIWSNVPNIDPESTYNNGNGQGYEYGSLPSKSSYGFDLRVKF